MQEEKLNSKKYLLDTNFCSKIIRGDASVIKWLIESKDSLFVICPIVSGELYYMVSKSTHKEVNLGRLENFLSDIEIYPIDKEVSKIYGAIKVALLSYYGPKNEEKRIKIKLEDIGFTENDIWIASVVKRYKLALISLDRDFERMKNVINLELEQLS